MAKVFLIKDGDRLAPADEESQMIIRKLPVDEVMEVPISLGQPPKKTHLNQNSIFKLLFFAPFHQHIHRRTTKKSCHR